MTDSKRPATPSSASSSSSAGRWVFSALAWLLGLLVAGSLCGAMLVSLALVLAYPNLPDIQGLTDYRPKLPLRVFSNDKVLIGEFGEERRRFVPIREIPKVMQHAVLAIEDARFYEHRGVDYLGVIRAGLANFGEVKSQGASTITMQVARNFYLSSEKTFTRKIYEMLLALKIESQLSKEQILEVYMNQIYLGQRAYGFAAASETYFGKPLSEITVAEAAMLAGLPKAPSAYNPIVNPRRATIRQQYIIDRMLENGFITAAQHAQAKSQTLHYRAPGRVSLHAEYLAEMARQLIHAQYGENTYTRGLNVYTTIRSPEQTVAYRALRRGLMDYERRQAYRGPEGFVALPEDAAELDTRVAEALVDYPDNDEVRAAVVMSASPAKVEALLQNGELVTITGEGLRPARSGLSPKANPQAQIRRGSVIRVIEVERSDKTQWSITQLPEVEGAFVSIDPRNGSIRALVGGFDHAKSKFNHVTQAWRQPGSSFKPFIYSAALEKGFTPATVINDAPLFFSATTTGSHPWEPKNYDGSFEGPMTMRRALAKSKNMVSIRLLQAIGVEYGQQWVTRFGFDADRHAPYLPMALGSGSVTPLQMASAYTVFANGGYRLNPYLITQITDSKGNVLVETKPPVLDESWRAIDARNAFVMGSLMQEVTRSGTAARAQATLKRPDIYGKTGTTNDSRDAWFAGYHPTAVAVVWIGYDTPRKLGSRETGGGLSLPVWIEYMAHTLKGQPVQELTPPEGVVNLNGEWYYQEFTPPNGRRSLGMEEAAPASPNPEEKSSILDLFRS